jgi:alpha-galactosidase
MVNPASELYEKHKDWVIRLPNRDEYYFRNQLVLDLSNPQVQDYVFSVLDKLKTQYPGIAYFKWDCNSPITNIYSPYLKDRQSHLYIEHVRGLYSVLERVKKKYPDLPMMLCSGGGGRSDYEALKYFTEFWPSDNTDPVDRIFIQWSYSHFFPSKTISAHVTTWGKRPVKFRTDVAMTGKPGFDIRINELTPSEQEYCREAVRNFKRLENTLLNGDQYRLVSPREGNHAAMIYVDEDARNAVLFAFDIYPRYAEQTVPLRLAGLNPGKRYELKEINLMPGTNPELNCHGKSYSGEYLMKVGIPVFSDRQTVSHVIELKALN